jgi:hypothetical protein
MTPAFRKFGIAKKQTIIALMVVGRIAHAQNEEIFIVSILREQSAFALMRCRFQSDSAFVLQFLLKLGRYAHASRTAALIRHQTLAQRVARAP